MIVASALTACGSSPPTTGVLTGRVAACTEYAFQHPTIVSVYAHDRLVATKRLPGAGRTFRFTLSAGWYLVKDANSSHVVAVSKGRTRRVPEVICF
jgi:hypothetical protein